MEFEEYLKRQTLAESKGEIKLTKEQETLISGRAKMITTDFEKEVYRLIDDSDFDTNGEDYPLPLNTLYAVALENLATKFKVTKSVYDKLKKV